MAKPYTALSDPMKLLIVTGIYPPDLGGPASFVPRLASALEARGREVRIVTFSDVTQAPGDGARRIERIGRGGPRAARLVATLRALLRHGHDAPVWLVQGLHLASAITGFLLGKRQVHKVVGDNAWEMAVLRGWYAGDLEAFQTAPAKLRFRLLRLWNTLPLLMASEVVTPSRYLAGLVERWGVRPARIRVIYNAVERHPHSPDRRNGRADAFRLVTVCRLTPWKGVDGILRALQQLPDCRLQVLGEGPEGPALKALAIELGVAERVDWAGAVKPGTVRDALRAADAFVLNSTYEGLPHVVLEAFDAGAPVIATRVGGTPEVVRHEETGLLIEVDSPDQIAAAVRRLQADPELARALADQGRALLETAFSAPTMIDAYADLLQAPR